MPVAPDGRDLQKTGSIVQARVGLLRRLRAKLEPGGQPDTVRKVIGLEDQQRRETNNG